jgi:adenine deaminase
MSTTNSFSIKGNLADVWKQKIYFAKIEVADGVISTIKNLGDEKQGEPYIIPGFIDSHVHIESSMLVPTEFAKLAVVHGTVATISDPHEIANVCGIDGVNFMIENGKQVPFKFYFGAPSCVPATTYETAGAAIDSKQVEELLSRPEIKYLSEMMNFPGVLFKDEEVMKKIEASHRLGKPVDGHAPGLRGEQAKAYIDAGISTDHECFTAEEALDKLKLGMKILIREGSAAKNFEALIDLLNDHAEKIMFCSDDKHPDSLVAGHINQLCTRAVAKGIDVFKIIQAACVNPVEHYKLEVGLLREGDPADFVVAKNLVDFNISQTYIDGELVAESGKSNITTKEATPINQFNCELKKPEDLEIKETAGETVNVIEALDGQLITNRIQISKSVLEGNDGLLHSNIQEDVLKIAVINRYQNAPIALGWIRNFGFRSGAIASTVAHDSHNIIAVGVDDKSICEAVNLVVKEKGGVSCIADDKQMILALPVAGLMSADDGYKVADAYTAIDAMAKSLGSGLSAPFMTLSFMALLVIPHIKLSDLGLFNGDEFKFYNETLNIIDGLH